MSAPTSRRIAHALTAVACTTVATVALAGPASADLSTAIYGSQVYWNAGANSLLITDTVRDGSSAVAKISYGSTVKIYRNSQGYGTVTVSNISLPAGTTRIAVAACRKDYSAGTAMVCGAWTWTNA